MDELTVTMDRGASGAAILRLTGALTLRTLFDFQNAARNENSPAMILDLSGVPYMDSAGLGSLLGVIASCHRSGRGLGVAGVAARVRTLFEVAQVDGFIPLFDTVESAELRLSKSATA